LLDETTPYFPVELHTDEYSRTKSIAEQLVIQENGSTTANGKPFVTCSLRPAAIYGTVTGFKESEFTVDFTGDGEERHLPVCVYASIVPA
jgi:hypothetical protein